jgi:C2 domain
MMAAMMMMTMGFSFYDGIPFVMCNFLILAFQFFVSFQVYLLPDKSKSGKRKTRVRKHTLNPVFDETLRFHMALNSLESRTLWLTVWHSDMFGRNDFLGEVMMGLQDKVFDNPQPQWYILQERVSWTLIKDFRSLIFIHFQISERTVRRFTRL